MAGSSGGGLGVRDAVRNKRRHRFGSLPPLISGARVLRVPGRTSAAHQLLNGYAVLASRHGRRAPPYRSDHDPYAWDQDELRVLRGSY